MQNILQNLEQLGLSPKESALYLAALKLGETGMTELAKEANLLRTSAYVVFEALEKRGLMGSFVMRGRTKFIATPPHLLKRQIERQLEQVNLLLPEIAAYLPKTGQAPRISYYEGKQGYIMAAEDSLRIPNSTVRHSGSLSEAYRVISAEYDDKHYIPQRLAQRIAFRALYFESEMQGTISHRSDETERREVRFLPEKFHYRTSTLIYGNKVALFSSSEELITVIIESEQLAESERKKFDLLWELLG